MPLNGFTLGQAITDSLNQMIAITEHIFIQRMVLKDIWCLFNQGQFDPIKSMNILAVIP